MIAAWFFFATQMTQVNALGVYLNEMLPIERLARVLLMVFGRVIKEGCFGAESIYTFQLLSG